MIKGLSFLAQINMYEYIPCGELILVADAEDYLIDCDNLVK